MDEINNEILSKCFLNFIQRKTIVENFNHSDLYLIFLDENVIKVLY